MHGTDGVRMTTGQRGTCVYVMKLPEGPILSSSKSKLKAFFSPFTFFFFNMPALSLRFNKQSDFKISDRFIAAISVAMSPSDDAAVQS